MRLERQTIVSWMPDRVFGGSRAGAPAVAVAVAALLALPISGKAPLARASRGPGSASHAPPALHPYASLGVSPLRDTSVALSADGNTALIGEGADAVVLVRSGDAWTRQAQLAPSSPVSGDAFGCSVALSADGDTALIGAPGRSAGGDETAVPSSAWVFTRSGGAWTPQAMLRPPTEPGSAEPFGCGAGSFGDGSGYGGGFGSSVALSGDGGAALVGAPGEGRYVGAAWAYGRSGSSWAQEGPKLVPPELSPGALFGSSLAVSADGDTALAGAPADIPAACRNAGGYAGGVWTFTRAGGMWTQQEARLAVRGACEGAFGTNIALSSDGDTALVVDRSGVLAFARSHSTWTQRGPSFPCVDGECGFASGFALSVALSGDGDVALIGATPREECGKYMDELCAAHGLVWTYHRFATTWVRQGPALQGPLGFGSGVALSGAADGALTGGSGGTLASLLTPPPPNSFSTGQLTASRNGVLDQRLASSAAGTFTAVARVSRGRLRLPHGSPHRLIGYGEGVASASGPGIVNLKIKPRRVVRHALFKHRSIQPALHITISFRPSAGTAPAKQTLTAPLERH